MSDSVKGGEDGRIEDALTPFQQLNQTSQNTIVAKLGEAVNNGLTVNKVEGQNGGAGAILVTGSTNSGEKKAVLLSDNGGSLTAETQVGTLVVTLELPANTAVTIEGPSVPSQPVAAFEFLKNKLGNSDLGFKSGLDVLKDAVGGGAQKVAVNVVTKVTQDPGSVLKVGGSGIVNEMLVLQSDLPLGAAASYELFGVNSALVIGNAVVSIKETSSAVAGDNAGQVFLGGDGNDTLIGGGGNDTMTGGNGADTFVSNGYGSITITDFSIGYAGPNYTGDFFSFNFGVNADTVFSFLTDVKEVTLDEGSATQVEFGANGEAFLTLNFVGVSLDSLVNTYQDWVLVEFGGAF